MASKKQISSECDRTPSRLIEMAAITFNNGGIKAF